MNFYYQTMIVTVNYFQRGKESAAPDKPCVIYAVIDVDGRKSLPFSTKIKVPAKYWMTEGDKKAKIKPSTKELPVSESYAYASKVNEHLHSVRKYADEARGVLQAMDMVVTAEAIKELIINPKPLRPQKTIIEVIDELRADLVEKGRRKATMLTYRTRRKNIKTFLTENFLSKLTIDQFRFHHFSKLQSWMTNRLDEGGSPQWGRNTINKHLTLLNQILDFAVNMEYIKHNPVGLMGLEYDQSKPPSYLQADDRARIYDCTLKTLATERDIAVFLYNTGLSYTDYESLRDDHLMRLPSGQWFLKKPRDKSDVYSLIPLLAEAQEVIQKYGSIAELPRPDISDLNKSLKVLGEVCESPFSLSTSVFRDTFSSMMENEYMIPDRLLMFMMGHTNPRQLRSYSRVHPARILHELDKNKIKIPFSLDKFKELVKAS